MVKGVEDFVHELLTQVFHAEDTAPLAIDAILKAGTFDLGPKASRIESPSEWTEVQKSSNGLPSCMWIKAPRGISKTRRLSEKPHRALSQSTTLAATEANEVMTTVMS